MTILKQFGSEDCRLLFFFGDMRKRVVWIIPYKITHLSCQFDRQFLTWVISKNKLELAALLIDTGAKAEFCIKIVSQCLNSNVIVRRLLK